MADRSVRFRWAILGSTEYWLQLLLSFLLTPILLKTLGLTEFGRWAFFQSLTEIGLLLSFGLPDALMREAARDVESVHNITRSVRRFQITMVTVLTGSACAVYAASGTGTTLLVLLALIQSLGRILELTAQNLMKARGDFGGAARVNAAARMMLPVFSAVAAWVYGLLWIVVLAGAVSALVAAALSWSRLGRRTRWNAGRERGRSFKTILGYATASFVQNGLSAALGQLDKQLLMVFLGPDALALYAVAQKAALPIHNLIVSATSHLFAVASQAQRWSAELVARFKSNWIFFAFVTVGLVGFFWVFSKPMLVLWVGKDLADHVTGFHQGLVLSYGLLSLTAVPMFFLNGVGEIRINLVSSFLSSAWVLGWTSFFLKRGYGIQGVVWGQWTNLVPVLVYLGVVSARVRGYRSH